ncbi:carbonic anhydrase-related protein 10 isoform X1 [Daktulosphaira vitifoliae]|uniref:carbonic anhydrase-related protein 10 isoform X1 n=1 Tax=Daktulosphaira vitifoliae TaxID=58002 RepID=UPI0021AA3905|nr:carbonic anhydrase-related protein 10 isoform X1 [Daktulosphaira vitifoliae]XP_050521546.1 carbonic anhydrase-related protein 10 isoform X1 [Daktulosphaira vitifoliae]XP_050521547.1 carbonic anhydrase-related protein 10 isoform X1 [Daktulosphaira vitifoliae]XP_050521551.1 carbonic anhydrase-related protein 10 isoform X1 [Daktulosphaira vitifoliae]
MMSAKPFKMLVINITLILAVGNLGVHASWDEWWTYDGISGPKYWGVLNPLWKLCSIGKRQSPIDIDPDKLLYDPFLRNLHIDVDKVSGIIENTGQSLVFRVDKDSKYVLNITDGPLTYRYQFQEFYIHYGTDNNLGSEHKIQGYSFPAEIQLYGYNTDLYSNMSEAQMKSQGIVGVSLMVQIGETPNPEFRIVTNEFGKLLYKGSYRPIKNLSIRQMLPDIKYYMTYEGSTTHPGCWETTVWIVLNKPIYITRSEMHQLRRLSQGSFEHPKAPLGNNSRPTQDLRERTVRTNINFAQRSEADPQGKTCKVNMHKNMYYKANDWTSDSLFHS